MIRTIALVTLVVHDYDAALAFYVGALGFDVVEDAKQEGDRRWVVVRPQGSAGTGLLLARAEGAAQQAVVGAQAGGRVGLFLRSDDFHRDYAAFAAKGVRFLETPRHEPYGWVAVFEDLYGNRWDLLGPAAGRAD